MKVDWVAPEQALAPRVQVLTTLRTGGVSTGRYAGLNLATHVGDDPGAVAENRRRLQQALGLPAAPLWLHQVHGTRVIVAQDRAGDTPARADAAITRAAGQVLAVLTADCLPVVLATRDGGALGIAHAGWRGLVAGVLEATLQALAVPPGEVVAWIGPGIGAAQYEVDSVVHTAFAAAAGAERAFVPARDAAHWYCDLAVLAQARLQALGVCAVQHSGCCTCADSTRFYSWRRDGETGRMATLAWIAAR